MLDLIFCVLVLTGLENLRIVPGINDTNPYDLYNMPISHGLVAALIWSVLTGVAFFLFTRSQKVGVGLGAAFAVFSHWLLDLPMHVHDLPVFDNASVKLGFGLWNNRWLALLAELLALLFGWGFYSRGLKMAVRRLMLVGLLLLILLATPFLPIPSSGAVFAFQALSAYIVLALLAGWSERDHSAWKKQ